MPEFIFQMRHARKAYGDKVVLDDVTLAFLPGAKIGVVGPNGMGKSTLLRMMAGVEQPSNGEARLMPGFTVGLLEQEPKLDDAKTVLGNVEEGVAGTKALLDRYNQIAEQLATEYSDELLEEMGRLQEQLDHRNAWDLESQLEQAMGALPPAAVPARPAAARRAHQPPGRRVGAVARAAPGEVPRDRRRGHARPVLPGPRGRLDPGAGPRPRLPLRGELLDLPGDQGGAAEGRGAEGRQAPQAAGGGAGVGQVQPARAAGQEPREAPAV